MRKKLIFTIPVVGILVLVIIIGSIVRGSQWKKDFNISGGDWVSNGYKNGFGVVDSSMFDVIEKGNPYYEYTVQNLTNHDMRDIVIVFECESGVGSMCEKWKYECTVGSLKPHEEKTIQVYHWDMYEDRPTMNNKRAVKRIKYDKV